jgi:hypothetical protein
MPKIVVEVGEQGNGTTFQLSPQSRAMLQEKGIPRPMASSLFVSHETRSDYGRSPLQAVYGPLLTQVVIFLTGLPEAEVKELGFRFVDPADSAVLYEPHAA